MVLECFRPVVAEADRIGASDPAAALRCLRQLPLDDFGLLALDMPSSDYPHLSSVLPRMADPKVQRSWTGSDGTVLLAQSLAFVRTLSQGYTELTGQPLGGRRVLDFGVGWGRLIRLMYHYSDPGQLYGCDPWDASLDICRQDGVKCHLAQSDWIPETLPFDTSFDVIYAFSVFTHLSERVTRTALGALEKGLAPGGVLAITIRPVEYWNHHSPLQPDARNRLMATHRDKGFTFLPHDRDKVDGDITYGDTSMTLEWLQAAAPQLRIRRVDRSMGDPFQLIVMLTR